MEFDIEKVYKEFHKPLFYFIRKRVPSLFIAEDILQDVFIKAHLNIDKVNDQTKVKRWLFQIARNSIIDYYRSERKKETIIEEIEDRDTSYEEDAYKKLQATVLEMIQQLPFKYGQSLFLADYRGYTQKEIADQLNISLSCAKARVQRARKLMKEIYEKCCHFEYDVNGKVIDYHPH